VAALYRADRQSQCWYWLLVRGIWQCCRRVSYHNWSVRSSVEYLNEVAGCPIGGVNPLPSTHFVAQLNRNHLQHRNCNYMCLVSVSLQGSYAQRSASVFVPSSCDMCEWSLAGYLTFIPWLTLLSSLSTKRRFYTVSIMRLVCLELKCPFTGVLWFRAVGASIDRGFYGFGEGHYRRGVLPKFTALRPLFLKCRLEELSTGAEFHCVVSLACWQHRHAHRIEEW